MSSGIVDVPTTEEVRSLFAYASKQELEDAESAFDTWFAQVKAEAQVKALREAKQEVRASSFWADGSDNYADRVRGWLSNRADCIAREAGIEQEES